MGIPASPGVALGPAHRLDSRRVAVRRQPLPDEPGAVPLEVERLDRAIAASRDQIRGARARLPPPPEGAALASLLDAYLLILQDDALAEAARRLIRAERINAEYAVRHVAQAAGEALGADADPFFRERLGEATLVAERVVRNLLGLGAEPAAGVPRGAVVVAHDVSAETMAQLAAVAPAGIVAEVGSKTSHTAILARALGIPAVLGVPDLLDRVEDGAPVAVDGTRGEVTVHPPGEDVDDFLARARRRSEVERSLDAGRDLPAETIDGLRIRLLANIEFPDEVHAAVEHGAEGIGLYRTEFLYVGRTAPPTEDEQAYVYARVVRRIAPHPAWLRTFDLGGDKYAPRGEPAPEPNPALGLRGLRLGLRERDAYRTQIRAILRAARDGDVSIMFPMVCGVPDFLEALGIVAEARESLRRDGVAIDGERPVGCMIEVPSAVVVADQLARHAAFLSIGTNDLVQYALAIDRGNERVASQYQPFHPAVVRLVRQAVAAARRAGIPVSLCGAMAEDPLAVPLLVGLGLDRLSVSPRALPAARAVVRSIRRDRAVSLAAEVADCESAAEAETHLEAFAREAFPDLLGRLR